MLEEYLINKHNLSIKDEDILKSPYFQQQQPLWVKNSGQSSQLPPSNGSRYMFTKIGKTFGCEVIRFLSISRGSLFYFDVAID